MADISTVTLPNNNTYDLSVKAEKIKQGYLENRIYLNTQPENSGSAVLPFLYNDLAFLTRRGGAIDAYLTTATDYTSVTLSDRTEYALAGPENLFDGSPSYCSHIVRGGELSSTDIRVIDLTLYKTFSYSNVFYIDFGAVPWKSTKIIVLVMNTATETEYVQKINKTDNSFGHFYSPLSHLSKDASGNTVQGFNKMRIILSGFGANLTTGNTRIAQIGLISYGSAGAKETFVSRGGCNGFYGSLIPQTNSNVDLGSTTKYWKNGYFTNINGVAVGNSPKFTDTTNLSQMTGTLSLTNGGTGATTAEDARSNLGLGSAATLASATTVNNNDTTLPTGQAVTTRINNHIVFSKTQPTNQQTGDIWVIIKDDSVSSS